MANYAEYCPIAAGAEYVADRWTMLILREVMIGGHRFNDIHRGIPRISRTLLSQRLRTLVSREVLQRVEVGGNGEYHLTPAGRELEPLVWGIAADTIRLDGPLRLVRGFGSWIAPNPFAEQIRLHARAQRRAG